MSRIVLLAIVFWVAFGLRWALVSRYGLERTPLPPRIPLSEFPMDALGERWKGREVPLQDRVVRIAGVSDYVHREYSDGNHSLVLFVGYVEGGASGGLHYPDVCFPGQGWTLENRETQTISGTGFEEPPRFFETRWTGEPFGETFSLYTFHYHGKFAPEVKKLRMADRFPGLQFYVIITVAGNVAGSIDETREAYFEILRKALPRLVKHFPQEDGPRDEPEQKP